MCFSSRTVFLSLAIAALSLLGAGLLLGELLHLHPCYFCNFQRLLYLVLAFFALCGALIPNWPRLWSALVGLTAGGGVLIAAQHSWMQYAPSLVTECGFGEPTLIEQIINGLSSIWPFMFMVTGFCTNKEWDFLGLSLANWSGLCFLGFLSISVWVFRREMKRQGTLTK